MYPAATISMIICHPTLFNKVKIVIRADIVDKFHFMIFSHSPMKKAAITAALMYYFFDLG